MRSSFALFRLIEGAAAAMGWVVSRCYRLAVWVVKVDDGREGNGTVVCTSARPDSRVYSCTVGITWLQLYRRDHMVTAAL
jgi:hypothetical protein